MSVNPIVDGPTNVATHINREHLMKDEFPDTVSEGRTIRGQVQDVPQSYLLQSICKVLHIDSKLLKMLTRSLGFAKQNTKSQETRSIRSWFFQM